MLFKQGITTGSSLKVLVLVQKMTRIFVQQQLAIHKKNVTKWRYPSQALDKGIFNKVAEFQVMSTNKPANLLKYQYVVKIKVDSTHIRYRESLLYRNVPPATGGKRNISALFTNKTYVHAVTWLR